MAGADAAQSPANAEDGGADHGGAIKCGGPNGKHATQQGAGEKARGELVGNE
jgi:hypothetical protein